MDRDFGNSIILGYGPTTETHCGACKGNHRQSLSKGFAYHCRDNTSSVEFVAGTECRNKITNDTRKPSAIPHYGAAQPIVEKTGISRSGGSVRHDFAGAADEEKLVADMSAWVQLRQKRLPDLGFKGISYSGLEGFHTAIIKGLFYIEQARQVKKTYDSITKVRPRWTLENLQTCHDVAMQITRVAAHSGTTARNQDFLASIKAQLSSVYHLSEKQVRGLNNLARFWGEPEWTAMLRFI
jgi:hypothetical protein